MYAAVRLILVWAMGALLDGYLGPLDTLDKAEAVARDYLETLLEIDTEGDEFYILPDLGGYESEVRYVRALVDDAATAQRRAGEQSRRVARQLRERGLSVTDTAAVLGVSRGRVSQLVKSGT